MTEKNSSNVTAEEDATFPVMMTVKEVSQKLRLSGPSVYRLLESGEIPFVRMGRVRRIKRADVLAYVERNTVSRRREEE